MESSNDNRDLVRRGLDFLREGLKPFVEQQMRAAYGESWEQEARNALRIPSYAKLNLDVANVLKLIDRRWEDVFRKKLETRKIRSWINESLELRNEYAHSHSDQVFLDDDAARGLDTIGRLLAVVSVPKSKEVMVLREAIIERVKTFSKRPVMQTRTASNEGPPKRIWRVAQQGKVSRVEQSEQISADTTKSPANLNYLFKRFLSEYNSVRQNEIWQRQSQIFTRVWKEKILDPKYELLIPDDTDLIIRMLDTGGRRHKEVEESVALTRFRQSMWERLFDDLKNKNSIQEIMDQIFNETRNSGLISLINHLKRENVGNGNSLTGKNAVAINALLCLNSPQKFLKCVSLEHRFAIMRAFEVGNSDEFKSYGEEIVLSNRKIIDGFKQKYGIDADPLALTEFLYSRGARRGWGRTNPTNIRPMWWNTQSSSKSKNF